MMPKLRRQATKLAAEREGRSIKTTQASLLLPVFILTFYSNFWLISANFERPVLGCIEAEFCKCILNTPLKALDEIYKILTRLHLWTAPHSKNSAKCRQSFSHFYSFIFIFSLMCCDCFPLFTNSNEHFPEFQICLRKRIQKIKIS